MTDPADSSPPASAPATDDSAVHPDTSPRTVGVLGMWLFIGSLSVLFAATIAGYLVVRSRAAEWPPADMPPLPKGLWLSTAVIVLASILIQAALSAIRRNLFGRLIGLLLVTNLLCLVFLVSQAVNWAWLISIHATIKTGLYMFTFYFLTGLHALHVIGGMVLLFIVTARAFAGRYSAARHAGVTYSVMYLHFLDVVWMIMFVLLFVI